MVLPIAKKFAPIVGNELLGVGGEVARAIARGQDWKATAKRSAKKVAGKILEEGGKHLQRGEGIGKRTKTIKRKKFIKNNYGILAKCP